MEEDQQEEPRRDDKDQSRERHRGRQRDSSGFPLPDEAKAALQELRSKLRRR